MTFTQPLWLLLFLPVVAGLWWSYPRLGGFAKGRKITAFVIRSLLAAVLIFALAGPQSNRPNVGLAVYFLLDRSDSIPDETKKVHEEFVRKAISNLGQEDVAGVIAFGREPVLESICAGRREIGPIQSKIDPSASDLASAVRVASAAFPDGKGRRIVVLSDGNETQGDLAESADMLASEKIEISYLSPPKEERKTEAAISDLSIPTQIRASQPFDVRITIEATAPLRGTLNLDRDGQIVHSMPVTLQAGTNRLVMTDSVGTSGFSKYKATLVAEADTDARNNVASGFAVVRAKPKILVLQQNTDDSALSNALTKSGLEVDLRGPGGFPTKPEALQQYEAVILNDINAISITENQMRLLQVAVRETGLGFAMIGGENSFLSGGYYNTPIADILPVDLNIRQRKTFPSTSVLIVVDCSGSMGMVEDGVQKIRLAARAAEETVKLLSPMDRVGVYGSSNGIEHVVEMQELSNKEAIIGQVRRLDVTGGGIFIGPSVEAADNALRGEKSKVRHLILLADGADSTDWRDSFQRVDRMLADKITTSVVAIGDGSDVPQLRNLAAHGGGRFYLAARANQLPAIFTQDTSIMSRSAIEEGEFLPKVTGYTEALKGIDALPSLYAYCLADGRALAKVSLRTGKGDPLYADWQYGLGKTMAFTSDAQSRWAANWVPWDGFNAFWSQAIRSVGREASDKRITTNTESRNGKTVVKLDIRDASGNPASDFHGNVSIMRPDGTSAPVNISQQAPGQFEGAVESDKPGTYLLAISEGAGSGSPKVTTSGFAVSYPTEYRTLRPNLALLKSVAKTASGSEIKAVADALEPIREPGNSVRDLWMTLIFLAGLLLPLDVAVRRIALPWSEIFAQVRAFFTRRSAEPTVARIERLRSAKSRVEPSVPSERKFTPTEASKPAKPAPEPKPTATAKSLLDAKRKRKEDEEGR